MSDISNRLSKLLAAKSDAPKPWSEELMSEMLVLSDAINEIDHLRSVAGVVSEGKSFNEYKRTIRPQSQSD